jgi:hypothetical protein
VFYLIESLLGLVLVWLLPGSVPAAAQDGGARDVAGKMAG